MEVFSDYVVLSRLQFAVTTLLHIIWPVFTIGLSIFLVVLETFWLKTGDVDYYRHARFWSKLFLLNFGVGVVTGIPLEFEFGTNWAPFSTSAGDFFGNILGFEGAMAFMLEAGFLGIMMFGWNRVKPGMHLFATAMVASGASFSALWIMTANAWMQTPTGGTFINGKFVVENYLAAIFNPNMHWAVLHMWVACLETTLFVLGGICAWYILRGQHIAFFLKAFRIVLVGALVATPLQIYLGDGSGVNVFENQPAKGAAIEGHWQTNAPGEGAAWSVLAWPDKDAQKNLWSLEIPHVLSVLATRSWNGEVKGLKDIEVKNQPPLLPLLFYAFRFMVLIGFFFLFLMLWTVWKWWQGSLAAERIQSQKYLLRIWMWSIPLGYIAVECGWTIREVGRQPWIVYGLLRTNEHASPLPAATIGTSLVAFIIVYLLVLLAFVIFGHRLLLEGPDLTVQPRMREEEPVTRHPVSESARGRDL